MKYLVSTVTIFNSSWFIHKPFAVSSHLLHPFLSKITLYAASIDSIYTACIKILNNGH
jgi:hypothetical protein